jgi:hypothetical protein
MTVTTYQQWLGDGSPWRASAPAAAMAAYARAHGVGYGIIGAVDTHLDVSLPEDHAPYSHTPWPGVQPYPYVLAVDLYTTDPAVARRLIAAKRNGALPCLKYINWTDTNGQCWHTSWQPDEVTRTSTDRGHIHLSFRTDHTTCGHAGFDPFIDGGDVEQTEKVAGYANRGNSVGDVLADLSNFRDWWYGAPARAGNNPPPVGSRAALLMEAILTLGKPSPVTLTDADLDRLGAKIAALLLPLTAAPSAADIARELGTRLGNG